MFQMSPPLDAEFPLKQNKGNRKKNSGGKEGARPLLAGHQRAEGGRRGAVRGPGADGDAGVHGGRQFGGPAAGGAARPAGGGQGPMAPLGATSHKMDSHRWSLVEAVARLLLRAAYRLTVLAGMANAQRSLRCTLHLFFYVGEGKRKSCRTAMP